MQYDDLLRGIIFCSLFVFLYLFNNVTLTVLTDGRELICVFQPFAVMLCSVHREIFFYSNMCHLLNV